MTDGKQISVAELLARNGQQDSGQNSGGRRRRAGKNGGVSVASLTGEFPVVQPVENPAETPAAAAPPPTPPQQSQSVVPPPLPQRPVPPSRPAMLRQPVIQQQPVAAPPQFPIRPPGSSSSVGPTVAVQQHSFGEPAAAPAPVVETSPQQPAKRRTRAERRAAEERELAQQEAAAALVSHARAEAVDVGAEQPTYNPQQDFPTAVNQPAANGVVLPAGPQFGISQAPTPSPMIDSSSTVLEQASIPGPEPAAFDPAGHAHTPPADAEATALHPAVATKTGAMPKLRSFPLGRFGAAQRTDDAPTEIRRPDPKAKKSKGKDEPDVVAPQQAAGTEAEVTSVWPAPIIGVVGARSAKLDEAAATASPTADPGRTAAEPKGRKDKLRKPKKQPQRASEMDFPTAVWKMSSQEPQLPAGTSQADELMRQDSPPLLAGPSLAGELMRGAPEEPFELTEHYHNPEPDDQPTDVDHPFFSRGSGVGFDEPLGVDDLEEFREDPEKIKRAWWIQGGQWLAAGVSGVLLFKGFEVLWVHLAMVALALAVTVILGLVALVRILRRTDDVLSLAIAVVVGVFVTLGPLAFTLRTG